MYLLPFSIRKFSVSGDIEIFMFELEYAEKYPIAKIIINTVAVNKNNLVLNFLLGELTLLRFYCFRIKICIFINKCSQSTTIELFKCN